MAATRRIHLSFVVLRRADRYPSFARAAGREDMDEEAPNFRRWSRASKARALAIAALLFAVPTVAWGVMFRMPGRSFAGGLPALSAEDAATREQLRADLAELAERIGERNVAHPAALGEAAALVERSFRAAGYTPTRQVMDVDGVACANLEAERRGSVDEIVLVGAHYDSAAGSPGANDNGSGVVVLLAVARRLAALSPRRTLRLVAFVNEEPPYFRTSRMGSAVYAARSAERGERIVAMLSLETLGYYTDAAGSQSYPFPMDLAYPTAETSSRSSATWTRDRSCGRRSARFAERRRSLRRARRSPPRPLGSGGPITSRSGAPATRRSWSRTPRSFVTARTTRAATRSPRSTSIGSPA
jgi:Peptidase family M28